MRFRIDPRDVPSEVVARYLGKTARDFEDVLPRLYERGFPRPDPDTGNFDLDAVDEWRKRRNPHLFSATMTPARDAKSVVADRLKQARHG